MEIYLWSTIIRVKKEKKNDIPTGRLSVKRDCWNTQSSAGALQGNIILTEQNMTKNTDENNNVKKKNISIFYSSSLKFVI